MDISGTHCSDMSMQGQRAGKHGSTIKYFLVHVERLKQRRVKLALLENVCSKEFDSLVSLVRSMACISMYIVVFRSLRYSLKVSIQGVCHVSVQRRREHLQETYHISCIVTNPADMGYSSISRKRSYWICLRKEAGEFVTEPQVLYQGIARVCAGVQEMPISFSFLGVRPH